MNINFNLFFNTITTFLGVIVMATMINVILFEILPKHGIDMQKAVNNEVKFFNYTKLYEETKKLIVVPVKKKQKSTQYQHDESISKMTLKAIYAKGEAEGWIIVESITDSNKNHIVKNNENFQGFELVRFYENYVVLEKENIDYKLQMKSAIDPKIIKFQEKRNINKDIILKKDKIIVSRKFLNKQIKNQQELMKSIWIREKKLLGKSIGFEILKVTKNSLFDKINLKNGDIIQSINNEKVSDYNKVLSLYKNIDEIDLLIIKINRKNKEMELRYEIN